MVLSRRNLTARLYGEEAVEPDGDGGSSAVRDDTVENGGGRALSGEAIEAEEVSSFLYLLL